MANNNSNPEGRLKAKSSKLEAITMDYTIDAKGRRLGHVATEIAQVLQGKKRASYDPSKVGGDRVLVTHYAEITVSGRKHIQKLYHRHTGYMGHLKTLTFKQKFEKDPKAVLREAVRRMLPKNFLNQKRMRNLIFADPSPIKDRNESQ